MIPELKTVTDSTNLLTSQFADSPSLNKLLECYLMALQDVEAGMGQLLFQRGIALAYGDRLDQIGGVVGVKREGRQDGAYRQAILNKAIINNGEATPNDAMSAIKVNTQASLVEIWEHFPACVIFMSDGNITQDTPQLVKDITPAGVDSGHIISNTYGEAHRPVDLDGVDFEDNGQWLPEYNESAEVIVPVQSQSGFMLQGVFNEYFLINTDDGEGRLKIDSERGSYIIYQGVFPDIYTRGG